MKELESPAADKWRQIIRRQRSSNMSVIALCRKNGIASSSLFAWKRKLADTREASGPGFVEARIVQARPGPAVIQIRLRRGRRIIVGRGFDRDLLAEVVQVLEGMPSKPEGLA